MIQALALYLAYVSLPTLLLVLSPRRGREPHPAAAAAAGVALWLPIEFGLLPALRVSAAGGFNAGPLIGILTAFVLFLVVRPLDGIGFTFRLTLRDVALAVGAIAIYGLVAVPLGIATGFLTWNPRVPATGVLTPVLIYLLTALPEEFLFRGIFQNLLTRWLGPAAGLVVASIIFGFARLPLRRSRHVGRSRLRIRVSADRKDHRVRHHARGREHHLGGVISRAFVTPFVAAGLQPRQAERAGGAKAPPLRRG